MPKKLNNTTIKRKINLKNDIIFKAFFSREGNKKFLIDFLNSILKIEISNITIKEEVNLEKLREIEKGGRLDIQAVLNDGIIVNIEMQVDNKHNMENRTDIYGAKTISRYFERGKDYNEVKKVIMINILNYKLLGFDEYLSETVTVLDRHRDYKISSVVKAYYIELPKFRESNPDMNDKLSQWLAFIDDEDRGKVKMAEEKNKILKQARVEMNYLTGDEEVRRMVELRDKWESDWNTSMNWAENKGIKKEQIKIAKKLLAKKMNIEEISEITELSIEDIKKLIKNKKD